MPQRLVISIGRGSSNGRLGLDPGGGTGTTVLVFSYTVAEDDEDTDGLSVEAGSLSVDNGVIEDGSENAAVLNHAGLPHQAGQRMDGVKPALVAAAAEDMGTAIGHSRVIAREMERADLVPLFDRQVAAPARCCLITTADSRRNPEVRAFREWILKEA